MRKMVAVVFLACGGSGTPTATCHGTLDGSLKGTFSACDAYDNLYLMNMNQFSLSADYTELPTSFTLSTSFTIPGEPAPNTVYTEQTMGIACALDVKKGELAWQTRAGNGGVTLGTCRLDFTVPDAGVTSLGVTGNTEQFHLHGRVSGSLLAVPDTSAMGNVNVTMDFDG
jgi:hypothetical protein